MAKRKSNTGAYVLGGGLIALMFISGRRFLRTLNQLDISATELSIRKKDINLREITGALRVRVYNPNAQQLKADYITGTILLDGQRVGFINYRQPFVIVPAGFTNLRVPVILDTAAALNTATDSLLNLINLITRQGNTSNRPRVLTIQGNIIADRMHFPFQAQINLSVN